MQEYELTDAEYKRIYETSVREFNEGNFVHKQSYENYLMRCVTKSMLAHLKANNIEVKDGKFYVSKEEHKAW